VFVDQRSSSGSARVLAAAVLWGTVGPAGVMASSAAHPAAVGAARLLVGGAVLAVVTFGAVRWRELLRGDTLPWLLVAAVSTAVYQATFLWAVERTGAALGTTIALGCAPVATGLCARWWTAEQLSLAWWAGTAGAVAGCGLILAPSGAAGVDTGGVVLAVTAGICYGFYTVAAKRFLASPVPPMATVAATLVLGGILLVPLLALYPEHLLDPDSLGLVAWIAVAGTALAYMCFVSGLRDVTAATAGTLSLAEPLTAAVLGVLVLGEHLGATAALGCVLLIGALVVVTVQGRRQDADSPSLNVRLEAT
jgi:DME family drug/metabolite transporter